MVKDKVSDYVEGVAAKYLSAVDAEAKKSNQHEIGGLVRAGFSPYLGVGPDDFRYKVRQVYISDDQEEPIICDSYVTWYDTRRDDESRGPEYRLYYYDSPVTEMMSGGDFFLLAKLKNEISSQTEGVVPAGIKLRPGSFLMVFARPGSSAESQLKAMFGLSSVSGAFSSGKTDAVDLILPLRLMLESIGVEVGSGLGQEGEWLQRLVDAFGGVAFPKTSIFSEFARNSLGAEVSAIDTPDATLMAWMQREESLFRLYERYLVRERLILGFSGDVDSFIDFSLSVQNRRKSRVGHAFEGHLNKLFVENGLNFEQGRGKGRVTENNSRPDFMFPSFGAYQDLFYPVSGLLMLGAKTSCKDRWRQVLSEANRIPSKHLITLEPAISGAQLEEMAAHLLQLVVPSSIQDTYTLGQRGKLLNVSEFIDLARKTQMQN
ncbi:type II restriction endonuclease [Hydrogenophaga sp. PAMC20947]|uniref:type II restriction endonuclease n=1 Tax=Hydrogenophaga sp. PAMC20947 TaxID=2565558 RepID=UPI00109DB223|nr:type II restriction endonuclease [Hydrogenophaga sp. PAMC20947]QCB47657.1 restriction endonuclease [Hydrogenophaga sp. PAMC20947]